MYIITATYSVDPTGRDYTELKNEIFGPYASVKEAEDQLRLIELMKPVKGLDGGWGFSIMEISTTIPDAAFWQQRDSYPDYEDDDFDEDYIDENDRLHGVRD